MTEDPHGATAIERTGAPLDDADAAVVLVHGRGARAHGMLDFANEIDHEGVVYLAPQAAHGTWYPHSFMAPIDANQPHLRSALDKLASVRSMIDEAGLPPTRTVLLGFSQGACLASEFAARNASEYGGVVALSGGLIGPEGTTFDYEGEMAGTPVFLGCGDQDPHIPVERVEETADAFGSLGASVDKRIYEDMGHGVIEDEMAAVREIIHDAASEEGP